MIIDHGASRDAKSVGLWFDTQVMHHWRKATLKRRVAAWEAEKKAMEEWESVAKEERGPKPPMPSKQEPAFEVLYVKGSTHGMGQQMSEPGNDGR